MKTQARATRTTPFYWIAKSFLCQHKPSWRAILAYNALAYFADGRSGTCEHFSIPSLAKLVDTSHDTIERGLKELEEKRLITRRQRSRKTEDGKRILLPTLYTLADIESEKSEPI